MTNANTTAKAETKASAAKAETKASAAKAETTAKTSSVYAQAIVTRVDAVKAQNKAKIARLAMLANNANVIAALQKNNVDAKRFSDRALYATEKCVHIVNAVVHDTVDVAKLNANAFATIKTLILAQRAKSTVTKRDIECALSKDQKIADDRSAIVYRRNAILSDATLAAQSQQCVDMMLTLRLVEQKTKNEFAVIDSALMRTFAERFADITL